MIIIINLLLLSLAQSFVNGSSRTVTAKEDGDAVLEWDISRYTSADKFEIYYNKDTNLATIQQSGAAQVADGGTNKYGKRLQVGKVGDRLRITIKKFRSSDAGTYEVDVDMGRGKPSQVLQKLILESEGISSSTGIIIGVVVGIVVLAILIALCCYCYRKNRDPDDPESGTRLAAFNTGRPERKEPVDEAQKPLEQSEYQTPSGIPINKPPVAKKPPVPPRAVYSELGEGGGRTGPPDLKPTRSQYAEARDT